MKRTAPAVIACLLASTILPTVAAANWTHEGVELGPNDPNQLILHGTTKIESEWLGGIHCTKEVFVEIELESNSNHGRMVGFSDSNPTMDCHIDGIFGAFCGTQALSKIYLEGEPTLTSTPEVGNGRDIDISNVALIDVFGPLDEPCMALYLTGAMSGTVDNQSAFSLISFSGSLEFGAGFLPIYGVLSADVPGTFGNDGNGE